MSIRCNVNFLCKTFYSSIYKFLCHYLYTIKLSNFIWIGKFVIISPSSPNLNLKRGLLSKVLCTCFTSKQQTIVTLNKIKFLIIFSFEFLFVFRLAVCLSLIDVNFFFSCYTNRFQRLINILVHQCFWIIFSLETWCVFQRLLCIMQIEIPLTYSRHTCIFLVSKMEDIECSNLIYKYWTACQIYSISS